MSDHGTHSHGPVTRSGESADETLQHSIESEHGDHHAHGGLGKYLLVFLALCGLTTMSFFTYSPAWPWRDQP